MSGSSPSLQSIADGTPRDTPIPGSSRVVFAPPRFHGDGSRVRNAPHPYQWVKSEGYRRSVSWDDLESGKGHWFKLADAVALGHTRETWDGGYIRSRVAAIQPGDRYGHLVVISVTLPRAETQCDCGAISHPEIGSLINGNSLSCGKCFRLHPMTADEKETGFRIVQAGCVCWHCTSRRWEVSRAA